MVMAKPATELTEALRGVVEFERQKKIAALAFEFWLARAFRTGSPESDWLRAEQEVRHKAGAAPRRQSTGLFLVQPKASNPVRSDQGQRTGSLSGRTY
jgi:hypothetical protein